MPKEIGLLGRERPVVGPILEVGPDGHDPFDAGGPAFRHPGGEATGLQGVLRVTVGIQQAHGVIRGRPAERARPQPRLEKHAPPATVNGCTIG